MLEKINKNYWPFFGTTFLFVIILISIFSLYLSWNKEPIVELGVEVKLPIIDLGSYYNLSKQLDDGSLEE